MFFSAVSTTNEAKAEGFYLLDCKGKLTNPHFANLEKWTFLPYF